nr:truncated ORF10 protein [Severe acute respiratory syndrome coronavirus 2]QTG57690.1 truncated ORF10 protein [Severe acute respiratory syndrome coronavirus 2]QUA55125.1 truncated ORF10 protein [Severe acute respiratory syndrome coronavirus 2]QUA55137.1 truncated ORF10 protein [Severe acute respiratory syndrome coronavirus 2]QUA58989.1 truncated ORF10 protein [Severe acute respiratory syndrome coronavirus 2]
MGYINVFRLRYIVYSCAE